MSKKIVVNGRNVWVEEKDIDDVCEMFKENVTIDNLENWVFKKEMEEYDAKTFIEKARFYHSQSPPDIIQAAEKLWFAAVYAVKKLFLLSGGIDIRSHKSLAYFSNFAIICSVQNVGMAIEMKEYFSTAENFQSNIFRKINSIGATMGAFDRVKEQVNSRSKWVGGSPSTTYNDIVSTAFQDATETMNFARHSNLDEMYKPYLGTFRQRDYYTSIAPSLCINKQNRSINYDLAPHRAYNPKQGEWLVERDKKHRVRNSRNLIHDQLTNTEPPLPPLSRRTFIVPTDTMRHENQWIYWNGRALGLEYMSPFLNRPDTRISEDRRYQRIYWSPQFIDLLPSCRHSTHLMLSAY